MNTVPRVQVVDDDAFQRSILERIFVNAGLSVRTYASAADLLEHGDLGTPAVLLLDVKMPGVSGLELQALLRERGVALPVIFLTGASNVPTAVAAMRNGAVDFIEKPCDPAALVAGVRLTYERHAGAGVPAPHAASGHRQRLASLTPREREVLDLMVTGQTSKMMARELGGSFRTIEIHRGRVMSKMTAASLADLVRMTIEGDAAPPEPGPALWPALWKTPGPTHGPTAGRLKAGHDTCAHVWPRPACAATLGAQAANGGGRTEAP